MCLNKIKRIKASRKLTFRRIHTFHEKIDIDKNKLDVQLKEVKEKPLNKQSDAGQVKEEKKPIEKVKQHFAFEIDP